MDLWIIFITGLTIGGLTCLAVQGGLLASVIAAREEEELQEGKHKKTTVLPTVAFLTAKLFAYTLLGFFLGTFGERIGINQSVQIGMQAAAGLYMIAVAGNLLNIHPVFRYVSIQPPRFLVKKVRSQSKSKAVFAPFLLGLMTIFIPCGTTLAMEALAISTGSGFHGALVLFTFVLGTVPLFFGIGWVTSVLGDTFRKKFLYVAAVCLLFLGMQSVYGASVASGFFDRFPKTPAMAPSVSENPQSASMNGDYQQINLMITTNGYTPEYQTVKKNVPVQLTITAKGAYSCASALRIPALKYAKNFRENDGTMITFTPRETGKIVVTCSMGMYTGVIEVL